MIPQWDSISNDKQGDTPKGYTPWKSFPVRCIRQRRKVSVRKKGKFTEGKQKFK